MKFNPDKLKAYMRNWRWWVVLPFVLLIGIPLIPVYELLGKLGWYHGTPRWIRRIVKWIDTTTTKGESE